MSGVRVFGMACCCLPVIVPQGAATNGEVDKDGYAIVTVAATGETLLTCVGFAYRLLPII